MASIKEQATKDGKRYFLISVSRGYGLTPYRKRWYWPDGWARRSAEREVKKQAAEFERACAAGEVLNRVQQKEKAAAEAAEAAKLKTVRQYAEGVYMAAKELTLSENTRLLYRLMLDKTIYPAIGDMLLVDVTPAVVQKLLIDYQKTGKAHSSCLTLYCVLNGVFEMAFLDDSIPISPMLKVKRPAPRKGEEKREQTALSASELARVLDCLKAEPLKWQVYVTLMADTGCRRGELSGLQWQDIDWQSGVISIQRNLQYSPEKGVYVTTPKSGKSRTIDVGSDSLLLLRQLRSEQAASCVSKWVFSQEGTAEPIHPDSPTRYFRRFGTRYEIPNFHPHLLRHTSASIAITEGADVVSVSERLGHSDTAVTLRMYAHANEDSIRRAGQAVRDAVKAQTG